jgi:glycosyltransferase involved in cell wall biosynthesis
MRILALNWNDLKNPYSGGAEVHLEELLRRLVKLGHHVTLVCSGWSGSAPEEEIEGVRILRFGFRYHFNLVVPFHLRRLLRKERFDVLLENINKVPFYTPLYTDIKTVVLINHLFSTTVFRETNFVLAAYVYLLERPLVSVYRGRHFNVVSESTAQDLIDRGVPKADISTIYSGIDRNLYSFDPDVAKYDQPTILYLGRVKKYKSIQHIISALPRVQEKVPGTRLMVVGAGDYLPALKRQAEMLKIAGDVEFPGFVTQENKVERMRKSHVIVLPSPREGWGLTNTEANAVGTPVVAADSPGLRDSVKPGVSGFLYEYGNIDQLAQQLVNVLADSELQANLRRGALAWADTFDWDDAAKKLELLLENTVNSHQ